MFCGMTNEKFVAPAANRSDLIELLSEGENYEPSGGAHCP